MPRTPIGVTGVSKAGISAPVRESADPVNGNTVANTDGQTQLIVGNTGTVTRTLTIRVTATVDGLPVNPRVIPVPAGQQLLLGGYTHWNYGPALLLDPEHADLRIWALRLGEGLPLPDPGARFSVSGNTVVADTTFTGVTVDGTVLVIDTALTSSAIDGNTLVVTV